MLALTHILKYNRKYYGFVMTRNIYCCSETSIPEQEICLILLKMMNLFQTFFGNEDLILDETRIFECFKHFNVPLKRNSSDENVNSYGYNLLEFCKFNNIFILNGRLGSDYCLPKMTCKNKSTVDYVLSSPFLFEFLEDFSVHDFSSIFSDANYPVSFALRRAATIKMPSDAAQADSIKPKLWSSDKKRHVCRKH